MQGGKNQNIPEATDLEGKAKHANKCFSAETETEPAQHCSHLQHLSMIQVSSHSFRENMLV